MAYIKIIEPDDAEGTLKEIYQQLEKTRGKLANIHKIQSLNPESITRHMDLYMTVMFGKSPLTRSQREMIAVVVSKANRCKYCQQHHLEALKHFWKEEKKLRTFHKNYRNAGLSSVELLLCQYAEKLTLTPDSTEVENCIVEMKHAGFDDRSILDAALVIAYFNFVNRIVLGLGVEPEKEGVDGYIYDSEE
ncbi:MAG: peroxidase [Candidatus Neomarinimicrobiota bacterium]|nr:peroxidase-related enzyme [Candidatus Neomarinimicrobiota bacterium]RKY48238.1 MAG: peroxidase [Candidatus Neomarinimicrobiota bacterium]